MPKQLLRYSRRPEVQAEVDRLGSAASGDFRHWATAAGADAATAARPETLVYAFREAKRAGAGDLVERLAVLLYQIVRARTEPYARRFGLNADDLTHEVFERGLREWLDVKEEFWEVNFAHMLQVTKYEAARAIRPVERITAEISLARSEEEEQELALPANDPALENLPARVDLSIAVRELPEPERTAIFLKFWEGWPESSKDPERMSIAKHLGVTDRTVRNYLRTGIELLRARLKEAES
jgi:RNA polymerase sigma factor (sigma-70 family)